MTVFDIKKEDQGDWFQFFTSKFNMDTGEVDYDKPEEDAAEFRIRHPGPFWDERRKDKKKEHKMVLNPSTRAMERVGYYPDLSPAENEAENADLWDWVITGFKNVLSAPDVEMKCTKESKLKLIKMAVFMRFLTRVIQIQSDAGVKSKEESKKK